MSLIREVGCWLVEPFVFMTAAFTLLPHGKPCWFGRGVMYWEICMAATLNGCGAWMAAPNYDWGRQCNYGEWRFGACERSFWKERTAKKRNRSREVCGVWIDSSESLAVPRIFSAASEVEWSSCCKNREEELGGGRTVHEGTIGPSSFFLWTADGKNCLSYWRCTHFVNENEEFPFEIASVWKYVIGSVSRWIAVSMFCQSVNH